MQDSQQSLSSQLVPICRLIVGFTGEESCSRQAAHPRPGLGHGPLRPCCGPLRRGPARVHRPGGPPRRARGRRPPRLLPPRWTGAHVVW